MSKKYLKKLKSKKEGSTVFHNWIFIVILYLIFAVIYNQGYKVLTKKMHNDGAMAVLMDGLGGIFSLFLIPLFPLKLPENKLVYLFLGLACIFYALNDRLTATVRKGLEASTTSMMKQLSTVFLIFAGFLFFKEKFILTKFIGALLIVFSNILIFYKKNSLKENKYTIYGLLAALCSTIAAFIDVSYSKEFNLPVYVAFTLLVPSVLIMLFDRIKFNDLKKEFANNKKLIILLASLSSSLMLILKLYAYDIGKVMIVAPLCSLTVILNVLIGYIFLKERNNLVKKVIASILIIIGLILIKL